MYFCRTRNQIICALKCWILEGNCREKATPDSQVTSAEGRCIQSPSKDTNVHKAIVSSGVKSLTNKDTQGKWFSPVEGCISVCHNSTGSQIEALAWDLADRQAQEWSSSRGTVTPSVLCTTPSRMTGEEPHGCCLPWPGTRGRGCWFLRNPVLAMQGWLLEVTGDPSGDSRKGRSQPNRTWTGRR